QPSPAHRSPLSLHAALPICRRHGSTSVRMAERLPRGERWLRVFRACWVGLALLLVAPWAPAQQLAPIPALDSPVVDTTGTLDPRSEEHTSELQSRENLVCRL